MNELHYLVKILKNLKTPDVTFSLADRTPFSNMNSFNDRILKET